jgi:hypothetical protein
MSKRNVNLLTIRTPLPVRYRKMERSIGKIANVKSVTGTIFPTIHLRMKVDTVLASTFLVAKSLTLSGPRIVDSVALFTSILRHEKKLVVDFRTPFPIELSYLGHNLLSSIAQRFEKTIRDSELVFAANKHMGLLCEKLGAKMVHVVPNYPTKDFAPTQASEQWKSKNGLTSNEHVALFTGGVRVKEIYGLDLLLESWKIVERIDSKARLIILGEDSIDYAKEKIASLNIKRCLLKGQVKTTEIANWINSADVCLAPRTPGFPKYLYDSCDSTKIAEYAALRRPIVASGYAPSRQYLLVEQEKNDFANGIIKGFEGKINVPEAHFWEENESKMLQILEEFWFK